MMINEQELQHLENNLDSWTKSAQTILIAEVRALQRYAILCDGSKKGNPVTDADLQAIQARNGHIGDVQELLAEVQSWRRCWNGDGMSCEELQAIDDRAPSNPSQDNADFTALIAEVRRLQKNVALCDEIIADRTRLLKAVPACPDHGQERVPHAVEWVDRAKELLGDVDIVTVRPLFRDLEKMVGKMLREAPNVSAGPI